MNSRQTILQSRIQELQIRRDRLTRKLQTVSQQRDDETRAEERLRVDAIVDAAESDRRQVEEELVKLEDELAALSAPRVPATPSHVSATPSPSQPRGPVKLFYSYAHEDEALRERLEVNLKLLQRQGIIQSWHDRDISAGSEWAKQISHHLENADIILLLISPDFIASDYCWDVELQRALERHDAGEACVIPIILRETEGWTSTPFGKLQALPKDAKPVKSWPDQDTAFADIARGIRKVAEELAARRLG